MLYTLIKGGKNMVRCNLSVLMAERGLKISRIASDTGLSRTTLTALANNYSQGIQFDTLNTLCMYLNTTPEKLIAFYPVDFEIKRVLLQGKRDYYHITCEMYLEVIKLKRRVTCTVLVEAKCFYDEACPCFDITVSFGQSESLGSDNESVTFLSQELDAIPISFKSDLESSIFQKICIEWSDHHEPVLNSFSWEI